MGDKHTWRYFRLDGVPPIYKGFVLDPEKCSRLSLPEKRELVHEIAQFSEEAPQMLSSFSSKELVEIICAKLGEERKYKGYAKPRLIERLLKSVSEISNSNTNRYSAFSPAKVEIGKKRKLIWTCTS